MPSPVEHTVTHTITVMKRRNCRSDSTLVGEKACGGYHGRSVSSVSAAASTIASGGSVSGHA